MSTLLQIRVLSLLAGLSLMYVVVRVLKSGTISINSIPIVTKNSSPVLFVLIVLVFTVTVVVILLFLSEIRIMEIR